MAGAGVVLIAAGVLDGFLALKDAQFNTLKRFNSAVARLGGRRGYLERPRGLGDLWEERRIVNHTNCGLKNANVSIIRCDSR